MDQSNFNPKDPEICHKLLISILPIDYCPICKGLATCNSLFSIRANAAPFSRIFEGLLEHVLLILQRLHDSIMKILETQSMKPITLGSLKDNSCSIGMRTTNDQTIQLAQHQDSCVGKDYQTMKEELQAKEVDDDSASLLNEREISQVTDTINDDFHSSSPFVQEKVETQEKARAPKKMVSINENVEIFPKSKTKERIMSRERSSTFGSADAEAKPLKSILKVGSKSN